MKNLKNKNILIIMVIYLCITKLIIKENVLYINILFWLSILVYFIFDIKNSYINYSSCNRKYLINMFIISSIHIIIYIYIGFIFGFSKNPYNNNLLDVFKNIITTTLPIIGMEIARNVIAIRNKNKKSVLVFLTILLILEEINFNTLTSIFINKEEFFEYICSKILPIISCNILYTYLTLKESYLLVLIYRIFKELIIFLLPNIPYTNWFIRGTVGILSPTIVYILFKYKFTKENKQKRKKQESLIEKISYTTSFVIAITLICFMLGLFKYEPISILSNSMTPVFYKGDIVIYEKRKENELKEIPRNAIIIYSKENQNIAHRVVDRIEENNTVLYRTKGDMNNVADMDLVQINQIKGIYVFNIKYIGFPSVWLYEYFNKEAK